MNDIFSIQRFGRLLKNDMIRYVSRYYGGIAIFLAIMPVVWGISALLGAGPIGTGSRWSGIFSLTFLCTFIAPFMIYGTANNRKKGVDFTMLPASGLEKFLSMTLLCTVALPLLFLLASLLIDTLLYCIPNNIYQKTLFSGNMLSGKNMSSLGQLMLFQCFALAGNMIFRKNKLSKTVLSLIGLGTVLSLIIFLSIYHIILQEVKPLEGTGTETVAGLQEEPHRAAAEFTENGNKAGDTLLPSNIINGNTLSPQALEQAERQTNHTHITVSSERKNQHFTVRRNGKTYTMNGSLYYFLEENARGLEIALKILCFGLIPLLMYFITYRRIKKQQL